MENWTQEDRDEWNHLNAMDEFDRSPEEDVRLRGLQAKREYLAMRKKDAVDDAIRKSGPFHKIALILMLAAVGSCLGGVAKSSGELLGVGVVLFIAAGAANGLNAWFTGVK